ncbi:flagellar protein FlaG [Syntrophomonas curvata]
MRVEGQRTATDYTASNLGTEQSKMVNDKERSTNQTKISVAEVKKQQHPNEEEIRNTTNVMNEVMRISNHHLQFKVHKESGRIQVKVIDSDSQKVIREIPPEKILECSAMIRDMLDEMAGILLDEII